VPDTAPDWLQGRFRYHKDPIHHHARIYRIHTRVHHTSRSGRVASRSEGSHFALRRE
jgi:hypothetical protein